MRHLLKWSGVGRGVMQLDKRTYDVGVNTDGTAYINEYCPDSSGMIRRETIQDGITSEQLAWEVVRRIEAAIGLLQ